MAVAASTEAVVGLAFATEHYLFPKVAGDGSRAIGICRFSFTWGIIAGIDECGYTDRWCYHDLPAACVALCKWDGNAGTEPDGWHRHTPSWRRRPDGDATREYVLP